MRYKFYVPNVIVYAGTLLSMGLRPASSRVHCTLHGGCYHYAKCIGVVSTMHLTTGVLGRKILPSSKSPD